MEKVELRPWEIDAMTYGQLRLYFTESDSQRLTIADAQEAAKAYWKKQEAAGLKPPA